MKISAINTVPKWRGFCLKKSWVTLLTCFLFSQIFAQQDAKFTQYMYNTAVVNPAYVAGSNSLRVLALHRSQWVGVEKAPSTQSITVDGIFKREKLSFGVSLLNDNIGYSTERLFNIDAAYTIRILSDVNMSLGLKAGVNLYSVDLNDLILLGEGGVSTASDLAFAQEINNKMLLNLGAGVFFHTYKWYFGLSSPNLMESKHYDLSGEGTAYFAKERMTFYMIGGYVFKLSDNWKFKPASLTKVVSGAPFQVDLSANFLYNNKFTFGAAYRMDVGPSALVGFQITEQFHLGYAYDHTISGIDNFNNGSHEIFLRFELGGNSEEENERRNIFSPRFF